MDVATLLGMISAFGLVAVAIIQGVGFDAFVDLPAALIVVGGTLGVVFMNYPVAEIFRAARAGGKAVIYRPADILAMKKALVGIAQRTRRDGLLSIQDDVDRVKDRYLRTALEMMVDGLDTKAMEEILQREVENLEDRHANAVEIFSAMAAYSPAMGLIGTLIGLVAMLQNMSDPSSIGPAMAVALLTTFYGAILANMIFTPVAGKLRTRSREEVHYKEFIRFGVTSIASGENPRVLEQKLHTFLSPASRKSLFTQPGIKRSQAGAQAW